MRLSKDLALLGLATADLSRLSPLSVDDGSEQTSSGPVTEAAKPPRTKIANRDWINDANEEVDEEKATGWRYEFLGRDKDGIVTPPDGKSYTIYYKDLSEAARVMLTGFGAVTLMGNVTNTWIGDKAEDKEATAADAINARIALLNSGQWIDRTREGVGSRIDKDKLAEAVVEVFTKAGKPADLVTIRTKLEDPEAVKTVRLNTEISRAYAALLGRAVKTVDDVAALFG